VFSQDVPWRERTRCVERPTAGGLVARLDVEACLDAIPERASRAFGGRDDLRELSGRGRHCAVDAV
jgi:hypothetical protein